MDKAHLQTFRAVAELKHFAKAAAIRNLSQPAVSHQIAQLEEEVGARLFNRKGRSISLTVVGEVLLEEAHRVLSAIDRAEERVREAARGAIGRVRLGVSQTAALYLLNELLVRYRDTHAAYELHVEIASEAELLDRVTRNSLDMAVAASSIPTSDLRMTPLATDRLIAVVAPGTFAGSTSDLLKQKTWILREQGSDTRHRVEQWFEENRFTPARLMTVPGPCGVKRAVLAGLGIGVLSSRCVAAELREGQLSPIALKPPLPERQFHVIDHPQKHHGVACRAMLAALDELRGSSAPRRKTAAKRKGARSFED
jgi:DNA-binding transcriptional LysR family regulator